jgi:hypothetical protein
VRADNLAYTSGTDQDIYDVLNAEFGDKAADTIVSRSFKVIAQLTPKGVYVSIPLW